MGAVYFVSELARLLTMSMLVSLSILFAVVPHNLRVLRGPSRTQTILYDEPCGDAAAANVQATSAARRRTQTYKSGHIANGDRTITQYGT